MQSLLEKQGQGDRNYSPQHHSDKLKNDERVNKARGEPFVANLTARLVQELKVIYSLTLSIPYYSIALLARRA